MFLAKLDAKTRMALQGVRGQMTVPLEWLKAERESMNKQLRVAPQGFFQQMQGAAVLLDEFITIIEDPVNAFNAVKVKVKNT